MNDLNIDITRFNLRQEYFETTSSLHGINHTYRVMYHCLALGRLLDNPGASMLAFCAAYIHDLSRRHDGYCTEHGQWSVKDKLPQFLDFYYSLGLSKTDIRAISLAIEHHSLRTEVSKQDQHYDVVAILKDADALDRIRLGEDNLDVSFLRYKESHTLIDAGKKLFYATENMVFNSFSEFLKVAIGMR